MIARDAYLLLADPTGTKSRLDGLRDALRRRDRRCELPAPRAGRQLADAQQALYDLRRDGGRVCVVGEGYGCAAAAALAAQLPVESLVLWDSRIFAPRLPLLRTGSAGRATVRLMTHARRNLSLIVSELLLIQPEPEEYARVVRALGRNARAGLLEFANDTVDNLWQKHEYRLLEGILNPQKAPDLGK